ncbi:MAG: hypothetical protein PHI63_05995 [Patescibacteria group bacterium]|nr:hypothetical protein [Patescibacteria group bacterium]
MPRSLTRRVARVASLTALLIAPLAAFAQDIPRPFGNDSLVGTLANSAGYETSERDATFFAEALGSVTFALLSFTGLLFTILILYGGYRWMLARGNESEIDKAKSIIRSAIIGLIVTLASYSVWLTITYFI